MQAVEFNTPQLEDWEYYLVARAFDDVIKSFYDNPDNEKKYKEWLEHRNKTEETNNGN